MCSGKIDPRELTIEVSNTLPLQRQKQILMHEIQHGINGEMNAQGDVDSELAVDSVAQGWMQVIQDNKHLIDYLTKE